MQGARRYRLAVLFAVVIAGACSPATGDPGGSPTQGSPSTSTATSIAPVVESAGCNLAPAPGSWSESFRHDGIERTYDFVVPETARGVAMPVVLSFHGYSLSSEDQASVVVVRGSGGSEAQVRMLAAVSGTSVRSWVESWAKRNGCRLMDPAVESGSAVETTAYRKCRAGGDVVLQVIEGGEHEWPLSPGADATAQALSFFASHPFPVDELS